MQPGVYAPDDELVLVAAGSDASEWHADEYEVTESEEESIKERLQNLGYL